MTHLTPARRLAALLLNGLCCASALAFAPTSQPATQPNAALAAWEKSRDQAYRLIDAGAQLDAASAATLQKRVDANPEDLYARTMLLGHYFEMTFGKDRPAPPPAIVQNRQQNILWLIEHHPAEPALLSPTAILVRLDGDALKKGIALWRTQVEKHPDDIAILGNASTFFLELRSPDAQIVLGHLIEIDPTNPKWYDDLSSIYRNALRTAPRDLAKQIAARAMPVLTKSMALAAAAPSSGLRRQVAINRDLTRCSLLLDDGKTAAESCARLMEKAQAPENAGDRAFVTHSVNTALGLIALTQDKLADAKKALVDSEVSITDGGEPFQPDYALALALLQQGERPAVIDFLNATLKFCPASKPDVEKWIAEINDRQTPTFEASVDATTKPAVAPKAIHP